MNTQSILVSISNIYSYTSQNTYYVLLLGQSFDLDCIFYETDALPAVLRGQTRLYILILTTHCCEVLLLLLFQPCCVACRILIL